MATKSKLQGGNDIVTALICDGVRKEISGQDIIIGVYSDEINVVQLPFSFALTLYLRIRFEETEQTRVDFRVLGESGIQIVPDLQFEIAPPETGRITTVVIGPLPITIQALGKITFDVKFPNTGWEPATDIRFVRITNVPPVKVNQSTGRPIS